MTGWEVVKPLLLLAQLVMEWLKKRVHPRKARAVLPTQTVRVVADDDRFQGWSWGKRPSAAGDVPVMGFAGKFHLTAIDPAVVNVTIIKSYLVVRYWDRWRFRTVQASGYTLIAPGGGPGSVWSHRHSIPQGRTREVQGRWQIDPSIRLEGDTRPVRARPYFVDQLDNAHTTRQKVTFRYQA
jgi:hypothetical protein